TGDGRDPTNGRGRLTRKTDQDASGAIFSRGAATLVSPFFHGASSTSWIRTIEIFREREDDVDADILWTHRTRPQDLETSQRTRASHSAHIDHLFLGKKNDEENDLRKLSTESDHPQSAPEQRHVDQRHRRHPAQILRG